MLCSLPIVQAVHEPKKLVMRSISWLVRWVWCERWPWSRVDLREAVEFPGLGGALDFFLGKVLGLMRYAEREDGGARGA